MNVADLKLLCKLYVDYFSILYADTQLHIELFNSNIAVDLFSLGEMNVRPSIKVYMYFIELLHATMRLRLSTSGRDWNMMQFS